MFCGYQPSNLSTPENIEEIKNKWNKTKLTYEISNLTPKLKEQSINEQSDSAFKIWDKHSKLKFKKMKPNEPCNIKISFCQKNYNDSFDFDGKGGTLSPRVLSLDKS